MERLDAHVRPVQAALQERPEVLDAVRVNLPLDVADHVVDDLVVVRPIETDVRTERVRVDRRSALDVRFDPTLQGLPPNVGDDFCPYLAAALDHPDNGSLS